MLREQQEKIWEDIEIEYVELKRRLSWETNRTKAELQKLHQKMKENIDKLNQYRIQQEQQIERILKSKNK